ncbi:hypothetical protein PG985_005492 [Apiospora marii]|uniref:uncharacterized protein n=1 Tax=Apiospora marii TaxID=335849 RepID=UPI00312EC4D1
MYQVQSSLGFESMENAVTRLYNQLLLPFSDLVCLFVDDLGGMARVTEHLRSWLHPDQQFALTGIQPWLLLVVSKDLEVNEQLMLRELVRAQNGVKPRFRGYQVFNIAESVRQTRATKECQNRPWDRLQAKIWSLSGISRRRRDGLLFSVPHFSSFIHSAVDRFVDPGKHPLEVVEASRLKMPVAADLETHLITFLKSMRSTETVTTLGIPIITSSFILDHYPPGMHQFNPRTVFIRLYRRTSKRIYDEWPQHETSFPLPTSFLSLLENNFLEQYRRFRRVKSAAELHRSNLCQFRKEYSGLFSDVTCFSCVRRPPQFSLPCGHMICENCVRVFGQDTKSPWGFCLKACILCGKSVGDIEIGMRPDTASVRVLSIDGGGTRGIAPLVFIETLQECIGLPCPVQRHFDLIYGTSSGAITAAALWINGWSPSECIASFENLAKVAFQRRWWWPRLPILLPIFKLLATLVLDGQYSSKPLEAVLLQVFGEKSIQACSPATELGAKVGITVTTTQDASACIFTTYNGVGQRRADSEYHVFKPQSSTGQIPLWEIIRCSTAAPYYFKPRRIDGLGTFQDGGLAFNNPAAIAVQEAFASGAEPSIIVSLGTGAAKTRSPVLGDSRRLLQDSFPMRIFRAFWQGSSSHRAWQQLLRHTKSDSQSNLFRFDIEFEGPVPALDDVAEMQNVAKLARDEILHSPSLEPLIHRIKAELFVFELSPDAPFRFHNGVYLCAGRILCRLQPKTPEYNAFMCQLAQSSASLHVAHQRIIKGVWGSPTVNTQEQFHQEVSFQIKSRDRPFSISLAVGDYHSHISGSPFTLEGLVEQQKLNAVFGTADHRKRPVEEGEEAQKASPNPAKRPYSTGSRGINVSMAHTAQDPIGKCWLKELPNELLGSILDKASPQDGIRLATTCRMICWYGKQKTYEMAIAAIRNTGQNAPQVLNQLFDNSKLQLFVSRACPARSHLCSTVPYYHLRNDRYTLMHICAFRANTHIAGLLMAGDGVDVDSLDGLGRTPIHYAVNDSVARILVQLGADINGNMKYNGSGPLVNLICDADASYQPVASLRVASPNDRVWRDAWPRVIIPDLFSTIQYLIDEGAAVSSPLKDPQICPLAFAIRFGHIKIVEALLDAGADPNPTRTVHGTTETYLLLTEAINSNRPEIARRLLKAGARVDALPGGTQIPPILAIATAWFLSNASRESNWEDVLDQICAASKDINHPMEGHSAIWWAIKEGRFAVARVLARNGASWEGRGLYLNATVLSMEANIPGY